MLFSTLLVRVFLFRYVENFLISQVLGLEIAIASNCHHWCSLCVGSRIHFGAARHNYISCEPLLIWRHPLRIILVAHAGKLG